MAKAPADGYTVLLADNAQTTAPALYSQLSYDAVTSFRSIGMIGVAPAILFSGKQSNLRSIKDMAATQGTRPGGFTIGVGAGSPSHLISSLFQMKSKLKLQMVPYKGASQAATDVLGGQIDLALHSFPPGLRCTRTSKKGSPWPIPNFSRTATRKPFAFLPSLPTALG
ncbi:MAG: tripartite tricarboxylate transporter substrate-binding protein, partial [Burkholderiales bacterium]|nr:tripartite tricarboxylate transporter substrate-binding protein [Burkholderiales bacterium]